ncbi:MAG: hypothetical protein OXU20_18535 [Myxococcales bacterium]|nr:hypothetical protein [Myxococcales bacterium]
MSRRSRFVLWAAALTALHLCIANYFLSFTSVMSGTPLQGDDFDTHVAQTYAVIDGLQTAGKAWVYDVKLLAGQPEGTIFDADNKGWELWTYLLYRLGVAKGAAFNSYVLLSFLACPLAVFVAARLFAIGPLASLFAAFLGTLLWFFDSFVHWAWWVGMVAYASAGWFALLPLACFYRFAYARRRGEAFGYALATGVLLPLAHLNHPYSFFILAPPLGAVALARFSEMSRRDRLLVVGIVASTVLFNLSWLHAAALHWHYILDSAYFGKAGLDYLLADLFGVLLNPSNSGVIGTRASLRFLCFVPAVFALAVFRRERDPRFLVFAVSLGCMFGFSYLGAYIPQAGQLQPYRHVIPLAFLSALGAAAFAEHLARSGALKHLSLSARFFVLAYGLLVVQLVGRDVLYFVPSLVPPVEPLIDGKPSPISEFGFGRVHPMLAHLTYRLPRDPVFEAGSEEVRAWLGEHTAAGDRILVDHGPLGERLAWSSHLEVLGGFRERNILHSYANYFRAFPETASPERVETYLKTFAVQWVLLHDQRPDLERSPSLALVAELHGRRIYRNRRRMSKVLQGVGQVRARTNRIEVRASDPDRDLVVAYHFHEGLLCEPGCRVERQRVPIDRVGFIRVPAPHPRDLVLRNGYP